LLYQKFTMCFLKYYIYFLKYYIYFKVVVFSCSGQSLSSLITTKTCHHLLRKSSLNSMKVTPTQTEVLYILDAVIVCK